MSTADAGVGATSAIPAIAAAEKAALTAVTWFGDSPAWKAAAASSRPIRRLTNREYAGAPVAAGFWAERSRCSVARKPAVSAGPEPPWGRVPELVISCSLPVPDIEVVERLRCRRVRFRLPGV